jgi:hypothetical protein
MIIKTLAVKTSPISGKLTLVSELLVEKKVESS